MSDTRIKLRRTFCAQCGPDVPIDNEGCCLTCGSTADGAAADGLLTEYDALRAADAKRRALLERAAATLAHASGAYLDVPAKSATEADVAAYHSQHALDLAGECREAAGEGGK